MSQNKTSTAKVNAAEMRNKCLELRKMGMTYKQIGEQLRVSGKTAHKHVTKALSDLQNKVDETAGEVMTLELQRLDRLLMSAWPNATQGDVQSIKAAITVMERRAKLLGLDKPTKVAPTNPDGDEAAPAAVILPSDAPEVDEWLEQYRNPTDTGSQTNPAE